MHSSYKNSSAVCARVCDLVGTERSSARAMSVNLFVYASGEFHIGVPSALRWERAVARACNEAHHKPIFGVFAVLSALSAPSARGDAACC